MAQAGEAPGSTVVFGATDGGAVCATSLLDLLANGSGTTTSITDVSGVVFAYLVKRVKTILVMHKRHVVYLIHLRIVLYALVVKGSVEAVSVVAVHPSTYV